MRTKPAIEPPVVIEPNAVFSANQARAVLGLRKSSLAREIRLGRLRVSKRAGRYFIRGAWLLEWIDGGEVVSKSRDRSANTAEDITE